MVVGRQRNAGRACRLALGLSGRAKGASRIRSLGPTDQMTRAYLANTPEDAGGLVHGYGADFHRVLGFFAVRSALNRI